MKSIRIASRASKLALTQSNQIRDRLLALQSDLKVSIVEVTTHGDRDKSDFLYKSESVGYFTSEVEKALLEDRADLAVHSLKDLPTAITDGLCVSAIPERNRVADALITGQSVQSIEDLKAGSTLGTSSLRRIAQIRRKRTDIQCVPLRGNVETRVNKVISGELDAIVIACAGLNRLGMADKISVELPLSEFVPAPAQGALAVQTRSDDPGVSDLVAELDHAETRLTAETERIVLAHTEGGCSIPLGVRATVVGDELTIHALLIDIEGKVCIERFSTGLAAEAPTLARDIAHELLDHGGQAILDEIRRERDES